MPTPEEFKTVVTAVPLFNVYVTVAFGVPLIVKTASEPEQIGVVVVIEVTSGTILTSTVAELVNGTLQLVNDTLFKAIITFEVGAVIVTVACPEVGMVTV